MANTSKPKGENVTNKPVDTGDTPANLQIGGRVELERAPSPEVETEERAQASAQDIAKDAESKASKGQTFSSPIEALLMLIEAPEATQRQVARDYLYAYVRKEKGAGVKMSLTEAEVPYQLQERVVNPSPLQSQINREHGYTPAFSPKVARNQAIAEAESAAIAANKRLEELKRPVTRVAE